MINTKATRHKANINYLALDYYGQRLVTCSTDNNILIFEKQRVDYDDNI